ncbi:MAG TPA: tRNA pseudouridine(38-40) synthase TruA [Nitrospirota bacterium]
MRKNIKLILEYDGTNYHGWQSQAGSGRPTIQDALEQTIKSLTGEQSRTFSAGRTDAGVHALGQAVNFKTESAIPPAAFAPALNHLLPDDIRVLSSEEAPEDFHARYHAAGKIYLYRILNRRAPTSLYRNYAWQVNLPLNLRNMRKAAAALIGEHDFSAFRSSECGAKTPVRTLKTLTIKKSGEFIEVLLEADAFLMHMARNIVGTLVEIGLGRFKAEEVKQMLLSCERSRAGRAAPACGLYLVRVLYEKEQ